MEKAIADLEQIAERIRQNLSLKDAAREKGLRLCREVIRHSSNAIRAVHRGEFASARSSLETAHQLLAEAKQTLAEHGEILYAGFVHDAQKEYAEARLTLALVSGEVLPSPEALEVSYTAYLNGLGETAGELRRYLLDIIRKGDPARCEHILSIMDDIYGVLVTMDFPDALTYGLRRTTDVVRGVLEKTRGDLTLALKQRELERRLECLGRDGGDY
jgi:translin